MKNAITASLYDGASSAYAQAIELSFACERLLAGPSPHAAVECFAQAWAAYGRASACAARLGSDDADCASDLVINRRDIKGCLRALEQCRVKIEKRM